MQWYERPGTLYWYDQYALNEAETSFAKYDPERVVRELLTVNADIYAIYAANQYNIAYYPSRVIPQHPALHGRDYLADIVPALRQQGKRVILYINWLDSKHPEWSAQYLDKHDKPRLCGHLLKGKRLARWADPKKPEGRVYAVPGGQWMLPCMNSPKQALVLKIADELAANYEADAFHLDMFFHGFVCACKFCQPALRKILGSDQITWAALKEHWPEYVRWKQELSGDFIARLTRTLKARNPRIVAYHNAASMIDMPAISGISEKWFPSLDAYLSESDVFDGDLLCPSLISRFARAIHKPLSLLITSTPRPFSHSPISPGRAMLFAAAAKANGCPILGFCGIGARQDTTSDPRLLAMVRDTFAFWKNAPVSTADLKAEATVAVIFSFATRSYYEEPPSPTAQAGAYTHLAEFRGWCRRLIETHLPFTMEIAEYATDAALAKYRLLILPDTACTDTRFEAVVRRFVKRGGTVIATGATSLYDQNGCQKADFGLHDVLGLSFVGPYQGQGYAVDKFYIESAEGPIICNGRAIRARGEARVLGRLIAADPAGAGYCTSPDPQPMAATAWPAYAVQHYGHGQAFTVTCEPAKFYMQYGYGLLADWLQHVLQEALPERLFTTTAPGTVEIMAWRDKEKRLVLTFANRTIPAPYVTLGRSSDMGEIIPLAGIEVDIPDAAGEITGAECAESPVRLKKIKGGVRVTLNQLSAYAAVVLRRRAGNYKTWRQSAGGQETDPGSR